MTYEEWLIEGREYALDHPNWREGQSWFNHLFVHHISLAERIQGGSVDPMYIDSRLGQFHEYVSTHWS